MDRKDRIYILAKFLKKEGHLIMVMRRFMVIGDSPGPAKKSLLAELGNPRRYPTSGIRSLARSPWKQEFYGNLNWRNIKITDFIRFLRDSGTDPVEF